MLSAARLPTVRMHSARQCQYKTNQPTPTQLCYNFIPLLLLCYSLAVIENIPYHSLPSRSLTSTLSLSFPEDETCNTTPHQQGSCLCQPLSHSSPSLPCPPTSPKQAHGSQYASRWVICEYLGSPARRSLWPQTGRLALRLWLLQLC